LTRVSERQRFGATENRINLVKELNDDAQQTAVSGRRIRSISTDPVASTRISRNNNKIANIQQFRRTIDFAKGFNQKTEDALRGMSDRLMRAKELAIQQSNATWDPEAREIVAEEVRNIADEIVQLGNATYADKYIFAGFRNQQPPISPDGSYAGDDGVVFVQVDEDSWRPLNLSGRQIFEVPPNEEGRSEPLVQTIREMYRALSQNDINLLHKTMTRLDGAINEVVKSTAALGAQQSALDEVARRVERSEESYLAENNELEDADPVKMAMELRRAKGAMEFTLQSSSQMIQPTLLNFLK
jgi:flagellar hook-associated protein 3 FlgL